MGKNLRIAILGGSFYGWGGGIDFLYAIVKGIIAKQTNLENIFLFLPKPKKSFKNRLKTYRKWLIDHFNKALSTEKQIDNDMGPLIRSMLSLNPNMKIIYYQDKKELVFELTKNKIDVALPTTDSLGKDFPIPWIGYVYDFQHKYYPEFFSEKECSYRDRHFARILNEAEAVIVNACAVKNDINKFLPNSHAEVFNLPFAPFFHEDWFKEIDFSSLIQKYNLPQNYFIISNQLWVHKSHITAIEALAKLRKDKKIKDIHLICTGETHDYRHPEYFDNLKTKINQLGLSEFVHFLGYIPKEDQIAIMRNSIAVLQPTLFEGGPGGGAVYNAVVLGLPSIVSDIPVNLEVEDENTVFFKTGSPDDMMEKMFEILNQRIPSPTKEVLLLKGNKYLEKFGDRIFETIDYVLKCKN